MKAFLTSRGAHVRVVHLEPGPDGRKVGLDDALAAGTTLEVLAAESTEDLRLSTPAQDHRPELDVSTLERRVALAAFAHLIQTGAVYWTN